MRGLWFTVKLEFREVVRLSPRLRSNVTSHNGDCLLDEVSQMDVEQGVSLRSYQTSDHLTESRLHEETA